MANFRIKKLNRNAFENFSDKKRRIIAEQEMQETVYKTDENEIGSDEIEPTKETTQG